MSLRSITVLFFCGALASCANLTLDLDGDQDVTEDTEEVDDLEVVDTEDIADGEDVTPDTDPGDGGEDIEDTDDDSVSFCPDVAESCEEGQSRCSPDGLGVQNCNAVCLVYLPDSETECGDGELCYEDGDTASCSEPPFDECDPLAPGSDVCVDAQGFAPCERDGQLGDVQDCGENSRCANGACRSPIVETGSSCNTSADCNDFCLCGSDFTARVSGECDEQPIRAGFCTVNDCERDGCLEGEACVLLENSNFAESNNICLALTPCSDKQPGDACSTGGRFGYVCRSVPVPAQTPGTVEWRVACYDDRPIGVGMVCDSSGECLGDSCKRRSTSKVCTQSCISDTNCPGETRCVYDPDRIDIQDNSTLEGIESGLCLNIAETCDGENGDINDTLVNRTTRTFDGQSSLISVCYLQE